MIYDIFSWIAKVLIFLLIGFLFALFIRGLFINEPVPEEVYVLGQGKIVSLRCTGAWSIYDIEVKFDDGTLVLVTQSFMRHHKLKEGDHLAIKKSSRRGYFCEQKDGKQ